MQTVLVRLAAAFTALGLLGGLAYRELTRSRGFTGRTELAVVHTHLLVLGTVVLLVLLVIDRLYAASRFASFRRGVWVYVAGVGVTSAMLAVNGVRTVVGDGPSKALAGVSGLGHLTVTVGLVLLFLGLGRAVRSDAATAPVA